MNRIYLVLFCIVCFGKSIAQTIDKSKLFPPFIETKAPEKKIQIQKTDSLIYENWEWGEYRKLIGNVQLKDSSAYMWCDSAILDITANYLTAYGKPLHLKNGDSIDIWGNFLEYFGDQKQARLTGNAIMKDKKMVLTAPEIYYNTASDMGYYNIGGRMVKDETILTSQIAYYYHKNGEAIFYNNVELKTKETTIVSDSMRYNIDNEIVYFIAKTKITNKDGNIIYTDKGSFDTKTEKATFDKNTAITKENSIIKGDTINYDNKTKNAIAQGNVSFQDTVENVTILSGQSLYLDKTQYIRATKDPLLINVSVNKDDTIQKQDTMFLSADTLIAYKIAHQTYNEDSTINIDSLKIMYAYHHTKMFRRNLSAVCDSLYYTELNDVFKLYYNPILWIDSLQISGDSIYIYSENDKISHISVFGNAFIIHWVENEIFNQIKGKIINIFIRDNKIVLMDVDGSSESIYFIKDDNKGYIGGNQSTSGNIAIYFKNGEIDRLKLKNAPEATFTPMKKISPPNYRLSGFNWQWQIKPKNKYDIIRNKKQYDDFVKSNSLFYEK